MSLPTDLIDRGAARLNAASNWARVYSRLTRSVVARTVRGRPAFGPGDCDRADDVPVGVSLPAGPWLAVTNVAAVDGAPAAVPSAPPSGDTAPPVTFDTLPCNQVAVVWRHTGSPDLLTGTASLQAWVHTSLGWLRLADGAVSNLPPNTEWRIDVGGRRLALQITASSGPENLDFIVGAEL